MFDLSWRPMTVSTAHKLDSKLKRKRKCRWGVYLHEPATHTKRSAKLAKRKLTRKAEERRKARQRESKEEKREAKRQADLRKLSAVS